MYRYLFLTAIFCFLSSQVHSQTDKIDMKFGGYINWTAYYDSRQTVGGREGNILLFPKERITDAFGNDINSRHSFNMAVIQTRLSALITGTEFLNAGVKGFVEAEFIGNSDNDVNGFRLRHAYITLDWQDFTILAGQYWNPMFIPEASTPQIGANGGAPFQPFARNPQLRLKYKTGILSLTAAAVSQRDFSSFGPGGASPEYLKNAGIPALHLQAETKTPSVLLGLGGEYKSLIPKISGINGVKTRNYVDSYAFQVFSRFNFSSLIMRFQGIYGANIPDVTMIGGYAVTSSDSLGYEAYIPAKIYSAFMDLSTAGQMEIGLFAGYTKNLGIDTPHQGVYYGRGMNIGDLYRIAPRISYTEGKLKLSFEVEYTSALYGVLNNTGKITDTKERVANTRIYTSAFYFL
jgi:hypothetical protein